MSKVVRLDETDRENVHKEISQCQGRVIQTLVPTILALGLIAIADPENLGTLSLGCAFAVLFSSSLYVASLSFKIFRNATFLSTFLPEGSDETTIHWEKALVEFNTRQRIPKILRAETTTAAAIYAVLALTFCYIFIRIHIIATLVGTLLLLGVALRIFILYKSTHKYKKF